MCKVVVNWDTLVSLSSVFYCHPCHQASHRAMYKVATSRGAMMSLSSQLHHHIGHKDSQVSLCKVVTNHQLTPSSLPYHRPYHKS